MSGVRRFEELAAWRLAVELSKGVVALTAAGRAARDQDFCRQIRDSTRSAPRNIAEGFGRFQPRQFANFVRIARGSLKETRNHLHDGVASGYFTSEDVRPLMLLLRRALGASTALLKYLDSCKGEAPTGWDMKRRPNARKPPEPHEPEP